VIHAVESMLVCCVIVLDLFQKFLINNVVGVMHDLRPCRVGFPKLVTAI
jgi:hypothetical protein